VLSGTLGAEPLAGRGRTALGAAVQDETRAAIERDVAAFALAWFAGDAPAMIQCLHPDFVSRLLGVLGGAEGRLEFGTEGLVRTAVGVQGQFGPKTPVEGRCLDVRVLDVRARSASAVAVLGGWVLQVHLARAGGRWRIVNAMWEMTSSS
jgi:hypothetical protein